MANRFSTKLQRNLPHLAGVHPCLLAVPLSSLPPFSRRVGGYRAPRRVVLGIGVSFLSQFVNMAAGNLGVKSFIASARQKGAIEKVKSFCLCVCVCVSCVYWVLGLLAWFS